MNDTTAEAKLGNIFRNIHLLSYCDKRNKFYVFIDAQLLNLKEDFTVFKKVHLRNYRAEQ